MDFSKFTFRCSSLGYIMQDAKGGSYKDIYAELNAKHTKVTDALLACSDRAIKTKDKLYDEMEKIMEEKKRVELLLDTPRLSETTKTHLCDIYTVVKYGRTSEIKSKYLEKGLLMEEDAITQYCQLTKQFHKKNKERRYNEWIEGECDIDSEKFDKVVDTKVNWDIFTFNRVVAKPIKPLYWWQLDGYMWLWNRNNGELAYNLLNTPEHLIVREEKRLLYELFGSDANYAGSEEIEKDRYRTACSELRHNMIYDDIPLEERVRIFAVKRSEERIEKIKSRVEECRVWLNNFSQGKIDVDADDES